MENYNLLVLSPDEFENLSRDLIQKELNLFFESFTTGRDGGIDFRYARNNQNIILQCKRYESWSDLKCNLKKEASKSILKSASRYILTTTVGLTPNNKDEILQIFSGANVVVSDIFSYADILNLLSKYKDIEKKYYKLWLCHTEVIERILHAKVINQSDFEREKIENNIKIFVSNDSVNKALDILQKYNFVIISGIPGIGKTSLARYLAYYYLSKDYEELIYLTESINEGFALFKRDVRQVFLFDDFLGSRFLLSSMSRNEDKRIVSFIESIKNDSSKKLIFTTREYILRQANDELERLKSIEENSKCVIDLSAYTKLVRAKILYNHLYWNKVPGEYIASLLKNKTYKTIINHVNYSPRLIESITKKNVVTGITPDEYAVNFIKCLNNPVKIWESSFESNISEIAKQILLVATKTGVPILGSDLKLAVDKYRNQIFGRLKMNEFEWIKAIKEIDDSFIKTNMADDGKTVVLFHNPSIQDYLTNFLSENQDIVSDLIKSAYFFNQYFADYSSQKDCHKIWVSSSILNELMNSIALGIDNPNMSVSTISTNLQRTGLISYKRQEKSMITTLSYILEQSVMCGYDVSKIPIEKMVRTIPYDKIKADELEKYILILKYAIEKKHEVYDLKDIFEKIFSCLNTISDLLKFCLFKDLDESLFDDIIGSHIDEISDIVDEDIGNATPDQYDEIESFISELSEKTGYDFDDSLEQLKELKYDYYDREPDEDDLIRYAEEKSNDPDMEIDNLFGSLGV